MCASNSGDTVPAIAISRRCSSGSIIAPAERRQALFQLLHLVLDRRGFASEKIRRRTAETGIADPMDAVGRLRQVAALDFMWPLCASLDALQAASDREVNGAVVAGLEMQERKIADAAPVAAVQRVGSDQVERAGDVTAVVLRHHQQDAVGHALTQEAKELARQVRRAPFSVRGRSIESEERVPVVWLYIRAGEQLDTHRRIGVAPLALDLFALACIECAEEIVKAAIALVFPMKL